MIFLKAISTEKFRLFLGTLLSYDLEGKPNFYFGENHLNFLHNGNPLSTYIHRVSQTLVMSKETFKLQELSMVKVVDSTVNPETLDIPMTLKQEVKKYQEYKTRFTYLYGPRHSNYSSYGILDLLDLA